MIENASNFGGNVGMAFQLIDDCLDFQATAEQVIKEIRNSHTFSWVFQSVNMTKISLDGTQIPQNIPKLLKFEI